MGGVDSVERVDRDQGFDSVPRVCDGHCSGRKELDVVVTRLREIIECLKM